MKAIMSNDNAPWWRKAASCFFVGHEFTMVSCHHRSVLGDSRRHQEFVFECVSCGCLKKIDTVVPKYVLD